MISHISRLFSPTTESTDRRDAVVIRERGLGHERNGTGCTRERDGDATTPLK